MDFLSRTLHAIYNLLDIILASLYNKSGKVVFLGLDNAGKTTLLHMLKDSKMVSLDPTQRPQSDELRMGNITFKAFDMGGHAPVRKLWREYYLNANAIVFVVDAADKGRFAEAKSELDKLLTDDTLANVPFLILGNKIDRPMAAPEEELKHALGLFATTGKEPAGRPLGKDIRPMEVFMCSIANKKGYGEGFRWLSSFLK